jgi:[ribosomal protein S5]-alanine N-acetyltransferase
MIALKQEIKLDRFYLRHLGPDDVTDRYLNWFEDATVKSFIDYAKDSRGKDQLIEYIHEKNMSSSALFLGIFSNRGDFHVGNIKFEPIDIKNRSAVMGILIGDKSWRGKGVGPEVILGSGYWLKDNLGIELMTLGVSVNNKMALKAYQKIGFKINQHTNQSTTADSHRMSLHLSEIN